jgi:PhzF family phenazine biosynthesis protein
MRTIEIHFVDAFTTTPLAGNPAGVVLDATGLDAAAMRAIAAELARPATAFVGPSPGPGVDRGLRWFSPTGVELSLCGHGTIAAGHVLAAQGAAPTGRLVFGGTAHRLAVSIEDDGESRRVWFEPRCPRWEPAPGDLVPLLEALGLPQAAVAEWAPSARTSEGDLLVPVVGLDVLERQRPDLGRLGQVAAARGLRAVALVARETREPGALTHSRVFVPHFGIPEDPATGSAHAAIGVWLWETGGLDRSAGRVGFRAEQGDAMGRPGRLAVEVHGRGDRATRVRVGGHAVTVATAALRLA